MSFAKNNLLAVFSHASLPNLSFQSGDSAYTLPVPPKNNNLMGQQSFRLTCLCWFGDCGLPHCICNGFNSLSDYEKWVIVYQENLLLDKHVTDFWPKELVTITNYVLSGVSLPGANVQSGHAGQNVTYQDYLRQLYTNRMEFVNSVVVMYVTIACKIWWLYSTQNSDWPERVMCDS